MTKLTIGIGEDFPVEEDAGDGHHHGHCRHGHDHHRRDHHHHHHHHGHELHERLHRWWHERFRRPDDSDKKEGEG